MSLRFRLLLGLTVVAVVLVATAAVVARTTQAHLIDQVDAQLAAIDRRSTDRPHNTPPEEPRDPPEDSTGPPATEEPQRLSPLYVGFLSDDGDLATISAPNLSQADAALPVLDADDVAAASVDGEPFTTASTGDTRYRIQATLDESEGGYDIIALPLDDTDAAISRLIAVEAIATLGALGVLALVAWWVIRLGVRPVKQMADSAASIAEGNLSVRIPEGDPNTEAGELGAALNLMLGRIEGAFNERARTEERLRRFIADASHELRTPVTTIRGYADLYRHGGLRDDAALDDAMRRTEQEASRMGALVEDMLQLARLDQGRPMQVEQVDLAALVRDAADDARVTDTGRPIAADADEPVVVAGDSDRLRQVLANLVSNALVHTPQGTPVRLRTFTDGDSAVLEVGDEGPGMPESTAEQVFERFFRGDPSRARSQGGSGLGLSIVDGIVEAHGGEVSLRSRPGQGTTVRVTLPIGTQSTEPSHTSSSARTDEEHATTDPRHDEDR